ncbi:hypothetical protein ACD578_28110 (plasmid) [Microvirga sp. RSM25]|uniref:hypothetical protein n=1 Tax=Microvirga sp. RSM25 TaxID=3273802 RepID=UPI0038501B53
MAHLSVSSEAAMAIKCGLRLMHLLGLALGLGAATLLDLVMCKFLVRGGVHEEHWKVIRFSSRIVTVGLVMLWISGLGFLAHYALFAPANLDNPKVWAKIAIVGVLSLNGVYIHRRVLPFLKSRIGRGLFDGLGARERSLMLASGAVSATSWFVPLGLGAIPQLNFVVPATIILLGYASLLTLAICASTAVGRSLGHQDASGARERLGTQA